MTLSSIHKKTILECCTFILVLVFIYTGCSKLWDQHNFTAQLGLFIPVPMLVTIIAWAVPVAEIIIAIGLIIQASRLIALYAYLYLCIIFTAYIIFLLFSSNALPCSCGGVVAALSWKQHLVFNGALILLCIACIRIENERIAFSQLVKHKKTTN